MTGDHIMQGATVGSIPPHGKMKEYIESLSLLRYYAIKQLAPGHGDMITKPLKEIDGIIKHRLSREDKVIAGLVRLSRASLEELTIVVYDDVDQSIHPIAQLSLFAHLIKLQEENRVLKEEDKWVLNS